MKNEEHLKEAGAELDLDTDNVEAGIKAKTASDAANEKRSPVEEENGADEVEAVNAEEIVETETKKSPEELEAEIAGLKDRLLRTTAEFDNYKKRTQREFEQLVVNATEGLIVRLLPVLDDMKRVLATNKENVAGDEKVESIYQGLELIQQKLFRMLESQGLKEIDALGSEYNVELHDAMLQVEKEGVEPNQVVEEFETGYYLNEKVIRHSKVVVSK